MPPPALAAPTVPSASRLLAVAQRLAEVSRDQALDARSAAQLRGANVASGPAGREWSLGCRAFEEAEAAGAQGDWNEAAGNFGWSAGAFLRAAKAAASPRAEMHGSERSVSIVPDAILVHPARGGGATAIDHASNDRVTITLPVGAPTARAQGGWGRVVGLAVAVGVFGALATRSTGRLTTPDNVSVSAVAVGDPLIDESVPSGVTEPLASAPTAPPLPSPAELGAARIGPTALAAPAPSIEPLDPAPPESLTARPDDAPPVVNDRPLAEWLRLYAVAWGRRDVLALQRLGVLTSRTEADRLAAQANRSAPLRATIRNVTSRTSGNRTVVAFDRTLVVAKDAAVTDHLTFVLQPGLRGLVAFVPGREEEALTRWLAAAR
jgi:hypothetical protein